MIRIHCFAAGALSLAFLVPATGVRAAADVTTAATPAVTAPAPATTAATPPPIPAATPPAPDPDAVEVRWRNGFSLRTADGRATLAIGGRLQADVAQISDSKLTDDGGPGSQSGMELRRAQFELAGT